MRNVLIAALALAGLSSGSALAVVFLNEIVVNPPGSLDDSHEFIELLGTPGKKLDGYAIAALNGGVTKYFPLNSLPSSAPADMEIDELFSLDGLALGDNGLLAIGITSNGTFITPHPRMLADSNFKQWTTLWNGGLDSVGKINNDGSITFVLLRNRPGRTQADPSNPAGLRWGKDINHDAEVIRPVVDPQNGQMRDQYGNGAFDDGDFNSNGVQTLDLRGALTLNDISDDLEIVDELSVENDRGWEHDLDSRSVDSNSVMAGLPARKVHALDDAQGFNPDSFSRVDYRTKGAGYLPTAGGIGELPNGNNWQDTATEQWIRGDQVEGFDDDFNSILFYDNGSNTNPAAIQPYRTQVPLWLDDNLGADYDFNQSSTYEVMAGRLNPLAVAFVPGDADRDGDCDADDIAKVAAVFGDDDWIFSNSFADAPEGKGGDPATQVRPWDVDATGDNGIEASDLQWTLNFQGNSNGRIVGGQYDSTTPAVSGVVLNSNAGTACTVSRSVMVPSGHPLNNLRFGDVVELTVRGQVTSGANMIAGAQNGIMQFVHDVEISAPGIIRVVAITAEGAFSTTRPEIQTALGAGEDLGMAGVNGHSASFAQGLGAVSSLYRVTLQVIGAGSATIAVLPAADAKFAVSTPRGLKIGHTNQNGNPASATYPSALAVTGGVPGDEDGDGDVDVDDYQGFPPCVTGPDVGILTGCGVYDFDIDEDVDLVDYASFSSAAN